jgi:hypothetical protein
MDDAPAFSVLIDLQKAGTRFGEPAVRVAYERVVRAIESHGDAELYEGQPLTDNEFVLLESILPLLFPDDLPGHLQSAHAHLRTVLQTSSVRPAEAGRPPAIETTDVRQTVVQQTFGEIINSTLNVVGVQHTTVLHTADTPPDDETTASAVSAPPLPPDLPEGDLTWDIFISYSHRNGDLMRMIASKLREAGLHVWTDQYLQAGEPSFSKSIEDAIISARLFVVLLTPDAKDSLYSRKEIQTAQAHHKRLIPLLCRGNERTAVPIMLHDVQWFDCRTQTGLRSGLHTLIALARKLRPNPR